MFRNCVRVVLLGLLAAVSATAQRANYTDISGHYIEYDIITMSVQTQIEALEPVVKALAMPDVDSIYAAWIDKFQKAATAGTMSVQGNADDLGSFLTSAAFQAPSFAADAKAALTTAAIDFFKFHVFMPAATYDVFEYGVMRLKSTTFNFSSVNPIKAYMTKNANSAKITDLQSQLNTFVTASEKNLPGFKAAVVKELNTAFKAVWVNNPTRAPTARPSTTTPSVTSTSPTRQPTNGTSSTNSTSSTNTTTTAPTVSPELYIGEPMPEDVSATSAPATTTAPTPAPTTKKSDASVTAASVVVSAVVLAVAGALL